ncbi:MAG: histidine ammonia-lyase [Bacteroidota bacterium]|nr:histidine ammonia-lyase [Bacteroidota bacterium]MDX5430048.1 histidine ammonia-lyase [Bacteroidota bacterium]MDX5468818.1 histidine ammonia-lyase [Bacteroidota bacterium]
MSTIKIDIKSELKPQTLMDVVRKGKKVELADSSKEAILKVYQYLQDKINKSEAAHYGINTGFGSLCNTVVSKDKLAELQYNLLMSHACGAGDEVPAEIVRLMLLLKAQSLSYGYSGVQLETVERLIHFYNEDCLPIVYELGSLGASGDLAPLAHLSLPLIGKGEVVYQGVRMSGAEALQKMGLEPLKLGAKEGLALINGTQFISAYATAIITRAEELSHAADLIAAMSCDAFDARLDAFDLKIGQVRPHAGHLETSLVIQKYRKGSSIAEGEKVHVQDPYSFRCIPQVHGASKDALRHVKEVITTEINAVTDNPNIFADEDEIISGGNFHGQPMALPMDYLAMALSELGNISERRLYLLVSGQRGLPAFLTPNPGLHSGFMIVQYLSAGIVSQNKQYCTPASVDSIVSSNGQEDHVSMGANAATKCYKVLLNLERILALELLTASQALEFRRPHTSSDLLEGLYADFRKSVAAIGDDVEMHTYIRKAEAFVKALQL